MYSSKKHPPSSSFSSSLLNQIDNELTFPDASNRRHSRLLQQWMDKTTFHDPILPPTTRKEKLVPPPPPQIVQMVEDSDPDSFFSTTSSDSSLSSSSSTATTAEVFDSSSNPKISCFGPLRRAPKPVKTKPKNSSSSSSSSSPSSSRAAKIFKNLKHPISPGLKLTNYINSLFLKESSNKNTQKTNPPPFLTKNSAAIGADLGSKTELIKRYQELRRLNIAQSHHQVDIMNKQVLEEVAFDLLNNNTCWRKTHDNETDDESSCSSSDLFEIDHLTLIGNHQEEEELPVYDTTTIKSCLKA